MTGGGSGSDISGMASGCNAPSTIDRHVLAKTSTAKATGERKGKSAGVDWSGALLPWAGSCQRACMQQLLRDKVRDNSHRQNAPERRWYQRAKREWDYLLVLEYSIGGAHVSVSFDCGGAVDGLEGRRAERGP